MVAEFPEAKPSLRTTIREDLEQARHEYHALVNEIPDAMWRVPVGPPRWTHAELLAHIDGYLSKMLPMAVKAARNGKAKAMPNLDNTFGHWVSYRISKARGRNATRDSLKAHYDEHHHEALNVLDALDDSDFSKRTSIPAGNLSIEELYHLHRKHMAHHAEQIRRSLMRPR